MSAETKASDRIPLVGIALLVFVCFIWGGNMVSIKFSNQGMPPLAAATIRSLIAALLVWGYACVKRERAFLDWQELHHGIALGLLFALDFLFLYWGILYTDASRATIFLYTMPFWAALGAHLLLADDRLTATKGIGLILAFVGMIAVFGSRSPTMGPQYWIGDLMEVLAAVFWALTTIYIKRFIWGRDISHFQTLFAQLLFSVPFLALAALIFEWGQTISLTPLVVGALFYQCVIVAFFSYLIWFWMIHRYQVSRLTSFTFLVPMFGVLLSGLLLGESLTLKLMFGLGLVAAGIYLVNRPEPSSSKR